MRRFRARQLVPSSKLAVFAIESVVATVRRSGAGCLVYGRVEPVALVLRRTDSGGESGGSKDEGEVLEIRPVPMAGEPGAVSIAPETCRALIAELERNSGSASVEQRR